MARTLADELAAAVAAQRRVKLSLDELGETLVALHPELATAADRYPRLAAAIDELATRGIVEPSRTRTVRQGAPVPTFVRVVANRRAQPAGNPAHRFPWVAEMAWAASGPRRAPSLQDQLEALSRWIATHRGRRPAVPVRERSLEVFGDDKLLGRLIEGVLAAHPETVAALAVEPVHPPMAVAAVEGAAGRDVLVVENHTTFHSALGAAGAHAAAGRAVRYGWVGYGAGQQIERNVPSLLALAPAAIDYFGDLDAKGLAMAAVGARRCRQVGLPDLRPARALYEALLARGRPQPCRQTPVEWPEAGLAWLGPELAGQVEARLGRTCWLAQEWVGREVLTADPSWCCG